jgi:hypothetical protein
MKIREWGFKFYVSSDEKLEGRSWTLSAAREEAIKTAGLWNDDKKRQAAILQYMIYDQTESKNHGF